MKSDATQDVRIPQIVHDPPAHQRHIEHRLTTSDHPVWKAMPMADGALRGSRLGATSYETDDHVVLAPREMTTYDCPAGHEIVMPFSIEAEIPPTWECHCGETALLRDGELPEAKPVKPARKHWDMLIERRSVRDLEQVLERRLAILREARGDVEVATPRRTRQRKSA